MRLYMKRGQIILFMLALILSSAPAQLYVEEEMHAYVTGIEGKTNTGRGEYIKAMLRDMGLGYTSVPFQKITVGKKDSSMLQGENIIARIGKGSKRIVIGAHYDTFEGSPGANDNGSGVAVALALINHLRDSVWNYTLDFCFFDQEEKGLAGSTAYVQQFVIPSLHLAMINLDVEGLGDEIFIGPVGNNNRKIMRYVHEAAQKTGYTLSEYPDYPASDFKPFNDHNLENISISVVPKGDGYKLSRYVQNGYKTESIEMPQSLGLMHTSDDRSAYVSMLSLKMSFEFTRTLLLLLNDAKFIEPIKLIPKGPVRRK
jgi:Zn-dependent M28 family amino/carboxypeptidase